jgi:hypothetical protein
MTVYVAEIFGRGVVAFDAASEDEARARLAERPLRRDLTVLQTEGRPLWDGASRILLRPAAPKEADVWRASHAAAAASSPGEGWHVFLVPVVAPSRDALDDDDDDDYDDDRGD